jgi:hypothetical protein
MAVKRRRSKISGQFSGRPIEMLESPAFRALSLSAHRVLARIEIEHAHHGGKDNGLLPVTYDHFEEYGLDRHAIGRAIRELVALGFLTVQEGCAGNASHRIPNKYGLTYRGSEGSLSAGTDEWRKIETVEKADQLAASARQTPPDNSRRRGGKRVSRSPAHPSENIFPVGENAKISGGNPHRKPKTPEGETPTTRPVGETPTTSISRGGVGGTIIKPASPNSATLDNAAAADAASTESAAPAAEQLLFTPPNEAAKRSQYVCESDPMPRLCKRRLHWLRRPPCLDTAVARVAV